MVTYDLCDSLGDLRNKSWILDFSDWRVNLSRDVFELVMPIKFNNPTEAPELIHKTRVDHMYRAFVNTNPVLSTASQPKLVMLVSCCERK
jgi:hypothetical protein